MCVKGLSHRNFASLITMPTEEVKGDLAYKEFILYLYLCGAFSDFNMQDEEMDLIAEKLQKRNIVDEEHFEKVYRQTLHLFKSHNEVKMKEYIERSVEKFNLSNADKTAIFRDLKQISASDGRKSATEQVQLFKLKHYLGL